MKLIDLLVATIVSDYNCPKCKIQIYEPSGATRGVFCNIGTSHAIS